MAKYKCVICGYIYDETNGDPKGKVNPETKWEDVPSNWCCPICTTDKSNFEKMEDEPSKETFKESADVEVDIESDKNFKEAELSVIYSNLAKTCKNMYKEQEESLFMELSNFHGQKIDYPIDVQVSDFNILLEKDIEINYKNANKIATEAGDRGALRTLTWGEKATRNIASLLNRYDREKEAIFENNKIYLCEVCGFIYLGEKSPDNCPVCKVSKLKISEVSKEVI